MTEVKRLISVCPSERQLEIQRMEFYAFIHFGLCTFYDREWGLPDYEPSRFSPDALDTAQWVEAIQSAGMSGVILTCKHHDGFCLWDTRHTDFNVMHSPFGRDIARDLSEECARQGIRFGVYLSPWDMHEPSYGSGKPYDDFYVEQLTELLTGYGSLFTVWLDGACGEGPNGKVQRYDWARYYETVRRLQPDAAIAVTGPDIRWCGNEAGICRNSEFSVVPARLSDPDLIAGTSQQTEEDALRLKKITRKDADLGSRAVLEGESELIWYPAEVDTSIRPGWFYHAAEDNKVKSDETLWALYCSAVGGNTTLLLNLPPDRRGRLHPTDVQRMHTLGERIRRTFSDNLAAGAAVTASAEDAGHPAANILRGGESFYRPPDGCEEAELTVKLALTETFEYVTLMEQITQSQRIEEFELWANGVCIYRGTTVGYKKICRFPSVSADSLTIKILRSRAAPTIKYLGIHKES